MRLRAQPGNGLRVGHGPTSLAGLSPLIDLTLVGRQRLGSGAVAMRDAPRR